MSEGPLLEQVFNGMKVVDAAGDDIGKVDDVRLADPSGASDYQSGALGIFAVSSKVPETLRNRYATTGFFHVDGKGWFDTDRYVLSTEIDRVEGETVYLNVAKEVLQES